MIFPKRMGIILEIKPMYEFGIMNDLPSALFIKDGKTLYGVILSNDNAGVYGMEEQFNQFYNQPF